MPASSTVTTSVDLDYGYQVVRTDGGTTSLVWVRVPLRHEYVYGSKEDWTSGYWSKSAISWVQVQKLGLKYSKYNTVIQYMNFTTCKHQISFA